MSDIFYFTESLEDSYIYKTFNNANGMVTRMVEAIRYSTIITSENITEQYLQIKKSAISPLSGAVLEAFDKGLIEIRYVDSGKTKIPSAIPFIIRKANGQIIATIFINAFSGLSDDGSLNIPTKNLYAIMESAFIGLQIQAYPLKIMRSSTLQKLCMTIYTKMFNLILIKEFALSMDRVLCDKVTYVINKFFLVNMWGVANEQLVKSYASAECKDSTPADIEEVNNKYNDAQVHDIPSLIGLISSMSPRLASLTVKYFLEKYIQTYHAPAVLSMDYLPYLIFVINNVILGSFIVSQTTLANLVKNVQGIQRYYPELSKIV